MPGDGISVCDTHDPEVMAGSTEASVLSPTRARGVPGDKTPPPAQAGVIPEVGGSRGVEALGHARRRTCLGLSRPGPHGRLRVKSGGGETCRLSRAGCLDLIVGSNMMFTILRYS
jgi:hypothetical protein